MILQAFFAHLKQLTGKGQTGAKAKSSKRGSLVAPGEARGRDIPAREEGWETVGMCGY